MSLQTARSENPNSVRMEVDDLDRVCPYFHVLALRDSLELTSASHLFTSLAS